MLYLCIIFYDYLFFVPGCVCRQSCFYRLWLPVPLPTCQLSHTNTHTHTSETDAHAQWNATCTLFVSCSVRFALRNKCFRSIRPKNIHTPMPLGLVYMLAPFVTAKCSSYFLFFCNSVATKCSTAQNRAEQLQNCTGAAKVDWPSLLLIWQKHAQWVRGSVKCVM